jgi:hypothetical protein
VVASLLKLYLRELPEPLLTFAHFTWCMEIAKSELLTIVEYVHKNQLCPMLDITCIVVALTTLTHRVGDQ